jgi:hypothetical protein
VNYFPFRRERERVEKEKPKKKYKYWDVPPDGYEHLSPKEYKELQGRFFAGLFSTSVH